MDFESCNERVIESSPKKFKNWVSFSSFFGLRKLVGLELIFAQELHFFSWVLSQKNGTLTLWQSSKANSRLEEKNKNRARIANKTDLDEEDS